MNAPLTGQAYWDLMERTAQRVETWPDWKRGEKSNRPKEQPMTDPRDARIAELLRIISLAGRSLTAGVSSYAVAESLNAALTPKPDAGPLSFGAWQPIETAPEDGTEILAWRHDAGVFMAHFAEPEDATEADWFTTSGEHLPGDERPTHWMPLPAPPALIEEGEKALRGEENQQ